jgi:radical SAM superfamily enzyme YgiQ (UPF0313 family)
MELAVRKGDDRFVPPGAYRNLAARLRRHAEDLAQVPVAVVSAFDRSTRMLPFLFYDSHMFPPGAAAVAAALHGAGFAATRAVFQLWNPRFRPSRARLDGRPLEMLLVSSMQIHARRARELIADAWRMGTERPLIVAGGPKAIYEPYDFWAPQAGSATPPDAVVTGESYVLLDLLDVLMDHRRRGESLRLAFERSRQDGALERVPGLVYLAPGATAREPVLIDTGLQRLVQDLDELPHEYDALELLEAPHWGAGLRRQPLDRTRLNRRALIVSLLVTQGCRFRCAYCPIPAWNQRSWRFRSPETLVHVIRTIHERFGIKYFFGADDNFFNRRETAGAILTAMAGATALGRPFGERIRFATEATEVDTYRNRDLLPLARAGGTYAIWFGIEDLTASLVNKGQKPEMTVELFGLMRQLKISPMAMLMYHDGQPYYTPDSLYGLANQVEFLRRAGAVSMQCTAHTPAPGTREYDDIYAGGRVIKQIGRYRLPEAAIDGNHVVVRGDEAPWRRQLKLLGGYAAFYNPRSFVQALRRDGSPLLRRRIGYQAAGMLATAYTGVRTLPYTARLMTGRLTCHAGPPLVEPVRVQHPSGTVRRTGTSIVKEGVPAPGAPVGLSARPFRSERG